MSMEFSRDHTASIIVWTELCISRLLSQRLTGRISINIEDGCSTFVQNISVNLRTCKVAKPRNGHIIVVKFFYKIVSHRLVMGGKNGKVLICWTLAEKLWSKENFTNYIWAEMRRSTFQVKLMMMFICHFVDNYDRVNDTKFIHLWNFMLCCGLWNHVMLCTYQTSAGTCCISDIFTVVRTHMVTWCHKQETPTWYTFPNLKLLV
jgi:hypothetical protein